MSASLTGALDKHLGITHKKAMRLERAVRLALDPRGFSLEEIALMIGVAPITVAQWRMTPHYQAKMIELRTGVISEYDRVLRESVDASRDELTSMRPVALQNLRTLALSNNETIKLKASMEILDRDGHFAKVSKTSVAVTTTPNTTKLDQIGLELHALLNSQPLPGQSFTLTAVDSEAQHKAMAKDMEETNLEDLDLGTQKVQ